MPRDTSNALSEHVRRLKQEQERVLREMAEAERALRQKPKTARSKPVPERKVRINNVAAIELPRPRDPLAGPGRPSSSRRVPRRTRAQARYEQIKFLLLCLLLAALVLFVWKNLPG